jgi:hypothetical protein
MGITNDQHTRCHLNRLRRHHDAMEAVRDDWGAREEFELHAWAFARVLVTSDYMKHLLGDLVECHHRHTTIWELDAQLDRDKYPNAIPPIWALELVELILRSCRLMSSVDLDHNTEFYGASDALTMIEEWMPFGPVTNAVLTTMRDEDYEKWSGGHLNSYSWVGFPLFLKEV